MLACRRGATGLTSRLGAALFRALAVLAMLAATAAAPPARAQSTATSNTAGSTSISAPAALTVTQNLNFSVTPTSVNTGLTVSSATASGVNANFALTGGQTASVSVPATFDVTRVGGTETVTVRTIAPASNITTSTGGQVAGVASGSLFSSPVTVVGTLDSGMLSFSVGGAVTVANNLTPGQYQGVLTVVAQYN
jgi:hypothetical protein